jgi:hypothetical protein
VRQGKANAGQLLGLMQSLHVLQSELRKLPADVRELGHHGRAGLLAARDGILRLKAYVRQLRGKQPGRKKPINKSTRNGAAADTREDDEQDTRRRLELLRRNLARLRGGLSMNNGLQQMQPLEAPVNKSTTPDHLRRFILKNRIEQLRAQLTEECTA